MATFGCLGNITFHVSDQMVRTFSEMSWEGSARYAAIERHNQETLKEFVGTDADRISFTMYFAASMGVNPIKEISELLFAKRRGDIMILVIGTKAYGKHRWVIESLSTQLEHFDAQGNVLAASVNISLGAYGVR